MLKVLDRRSACVFWGIDKRELDLAVKRGFLNETAQKDILWEKKHIAWKGLLENQGKRICDLERPSHRQGLKQIKLVNGWGIYQYSIGYLQRGKGDGLTYIFRGNNYLEKAFATYEEAVAWCETHAPMPDPLISSMTMESLRRSRSITQKEKKQAISQWLRDEIIAETEALDESPEAVQDHITKNHHWTTKGRSIRITLKEAEAMLDLMTAQREKMNQPAWTAATKLLRFLRDCGLGGRYVKDIYVTGKEKKFTDGDDSGDDD